MKNRAVIFLVSFVCACVVLGGIFWLAFAGSSAREQKTVSSAPAEEYLAKSEDAQNILVIGGETRGGTAEFFMLLKIDPVKQRFVFTLLPPEAAATVNITTDTLAEHYACGGCELAADAVRNACNVKVSRYMRFSKDDIFSLIDGAGGIEYEVKHPAGSVTEGRQLVDGRRFYELITADERTASEAVEAFLNLTLPDMILTRTDDLFSWISALPDTDISAYDYARRKSAVVHTAKGKNRAEYVGVSADGAELSEGSRAELASRFLINTTK